MMIPISKRRRTVAAASRVVMAVMFPTAGVLVLAAVVASSVSAFSGPWNGRSSYCKGNRFQPLHHYKNNKNHRLHLYLHRPNNIGCSCSGSGSRHRYRYNNNNNNECSIPHRQRSWLSLFYAPSNSAEENNAGFFGSNNNNNNDDDDDNSINNSNDIINSNLAFFCLELGCTIPEFRAAVNEFKRRKITLSGERLEVEDEIASLLEAEAAESGGFLKNTLGSAFSSLWSLTTTDEDNDKDINSNSNKNYYKNGRDTGRNNKSKQSSPRSETTSASTTRGEEVTILEEERKELSERALAIQNLMANLQWLEDTGVGSSSSTSSNTSGTQGPSLSPSATTTTATTTAIKELANRYRSIARTEGIKIRASTATATTESETQSYFYATGYGDNDNESDDDNDESEGPASANNYKDTYTEGLEDDDFDDDFDDEYEELTDLDADRNDAQSKNDPEAPHPPYIPPTDLQFMKQVVATSDSAARIGEGDSQTDDDDDDEDNAMTRIANWFGKDRIDTNPFQK